MDYNCPYCENEEPWTRLGDDFLHHAGGVHCRFVTFRFATRKCGLSNQYGSSYILGTDNKPACGEGLRFRNWPNQGSDYHNIQIHRDDVDTFVERVQGYRREIGQI